MLLNHERFSSDTYNEPCVIQESEMKIFDMPTRSLRRDFGIQQTTLELDDNRFMSLSGITDEEQTFFSIEEIGTGLRTFKWETRLLLTFGISFDSVKIERSVYTLFMLLGDVGGLSSVLFSTAVYLLNILNYQKAENHLASNLYKGSTASLQARR